MNQDKRLQELYWRHLVCLECIRLVSEAHHNDPRKPGAIAEYNRQLKVIDDEIATITGKPPAITIGLKAATLTAKAPKAGG